MTPNAEVRIPSLDGVRAASIVFVVVSHISYGLTQREAPGLGDVSAWAWIKHQVLAALLLGDLGVQVFFAISGFLITSLLLQEIERTGTVNLPRNSCISTYAAAVSRTRS